MSAEVLELATREVQLWLCRPEQVKASMPALLDVLDESERARAARFHFERHRVMYVVAHALLREALSREGAGPPASLRFVEGEHGKPSLVGGAELSFNLSHTEGLVACVVTRGAVDLGVDVEHVVPSRAKDAHRFFAEVERQGLAALEGDAFAHRFFQLWTLKESFIKATGHGVGYGLDRFWFDLDRRGPLRVELEAGDGSAYAAAGLPVGPGHLAAVCVRSSERSVLRVGMAEPLGAWSPIGLVPYARSERLEVASGRMPR